MKRVFVVLICAVLLFCACSKNEPISEYINNDSFPNKAYSFDEKILSASFIDNLAFMRTETSIIRLNMANGEQARLDIPTDAIGADKSRLFSFSDMQLSVYSHSGEKLSSYVINLEIEAGEIYAEDDSLLIVSQVQTWYGPQSELFSLNLSNGKLTPVNESWKQGSDYALVKSVQLCDGVAYIVYAYSINGASGLSRYKAIGFDLKTSKVVSEMTLPDNTNAYFDYENNSAYNQEIYIRNGKKNAVIKYNSDSTSEVAFYIPEDLYANHERNGSFIADRVHKSNFSFALWDSLNEILLTITPSTSNEAITLIAPEGLIFDLETYSIAFTEETGISVKIVKYQEDTYHDKLRTKILAGDDDFDLFIITDEADLLLESILQNKAYQSISNISFDSVFNGLQGLMTNQYNEDHDIFGVPIALEILNTLEKCENYDIPSKMSYAEMFDICSTLPDGYALIEDPHTIVRLVIDFVQESHYTNRSIKSPELKQLLTEISINYNNGRLFAIDTNGNQIAKPILKNTYGYFYSIVTNAVTPVSYGLVKFPTYSDTAYLDLKACVMINMNSQNVDSATEYVRRILCEEIVYNNSLNFANMFGKQIEKNSIYRELSEESKERLEFVPLLIENSKPYTIKTNELNDYLRDIVLFPMLEGDISIDEATDLIIQQVNYMVYE